MDRRWLWVGFDQSHHTRSCAAFPPNTPDQIISKWQRLDSTDFPTDLPRDEQVPGILRGLLCVRPGALFDGNCSVGWGDEGHFLREHELGRAADAFLLHVDEAFFFPAWENMPQVTKRARKAHAYNDRCSKGMKVTATYTAGLFSIESWRVGSEEDDATVSSILANLSLQTSSPARLLGVQECLGRDAEAVKTFPCLLMPPVVGQLVFAKQWTDGQT